MYADLCGRGRRGSAAWERLADSPSGSPADDVRARTGAQQALVAAGLPAAVQQHPVALPTGRIAYSISPTSTAGSTSRSTTPNGTHYVGGRADKARDIGLAVLGWERIRFTERDIQRTSAGVRGEGRRRASTLRAQCYPARGVRRPFHERSTQAIIVSSPEQLAAARTDMTVRRPELTNSVKASSCRSRPTPGNPGRQWGLGEKVTGRWSGPKMAAALGFHVTGRRAGARAGGGPAAGAPLAARPGPARRRGSSGCRAERQCGSGRHPGDVEGVGVL